ncbi:MAG: rhomboid family intramembrane serine protease [Pirellulaceae bacterium]|nr:rhomboid family intramembrane serine protease [Pirellulaceae bacterium]
MGISSRDYYREPSRPSTDFREWEFWKKLIALNAVVFILQIFLTRPSKLEDFDLQNRNDAEQRQVDRREASERSRDRDTDLANRDSADRDLADRDSVDRDSVNREKLEDEQQLRELQYAMDVMPRRSLVDDWFALDPTKVAQGQIWRLVTAGFCHDRNSIWHILINMIFLWLFGRRLEDRYGHDEFALFYFASLIFSSFAFVGIAWYTDSRVPAIGASGAVWGVVALYALLYPYETICIYFIPVQIRILAAIYFLADLHPLLLSINGEGSFGYGVAHAAHVGGAIFGFLYWYRSMELLPLLGREPKRRFFHPGRRKASDSEPRILKMQPRNRTFVSEDEALIEQQMDSVLQRISQEGEEALSAEEREVLEKAKEIIRRKRASL